MDSIKKSRGPHRAQLTRRIQEIMEELNSMHPDEDIIRVNLDLLSRCYDRVHQFDEQLLALLGDEEEIDQELISIEDYEKRYLCTKIKADKFLSKLLSDNNDLASLGHSTEAHSVEGSQMKTYKLPKIEIRKFKGEYTDWLAFWAQFQKIDEDEHLHDSDKFQYLMQSIVPGTRAERVLSAYPQSAENYKQAVQALKDRFGDKTILTEVYVRQLLKLVIRNVNQPNNLSSMFDELEAHLRALNTLGVEPEVSAAFLYPMVESSLPLETIKVWQRSAFSGYSDDEDKSANERLTALMKFLRVEVKGAERLSIVSQGFQEAGRGRGKRHNDPPPTSPLGVPTVAGLHASHKPVHGCIFCGKSHDSQLCGKAQTMPYNDKKSILMENKACLCCLKVGHRAKSCKSFVRCMVCGNKHASLMCPNLEVNKKHETSVKTYMTDETNEVNSNLNCSDEVFLQTIWLTVRGNGGSKRVRALLDSGSQRSYILQKTAEQLNLRPEGHVQVSHSLFGGVKNIQKHDKYQINLSGVHTSHAETTIKVFGQKTICGKVPHVSKGPCLSELKLKKIYINDLSDKVHEIELLIGADYYGQLLTGRIEYLENGLVAMETMYGWTLSGSINMPSAAESSNIAMLATSLFVSDSTISRLWQLETIGIQDSIEVKTQQQRELEVREQFDSSVKRTDGRYVVSLPWTEGHAPDKMNSNRAAAMRRLQTTTAKLVSQQRYDEYNTVFNDWLSEDFIETVNDDKLVNSYYLPHRAVYKPDSLTTPVRPVFDASCANKGHPSLNDLLEKGPNLIELIPTVLLHFRNKKVGISADIRKAFQMIEVNPSDRDFLRFLWWTDKERKEAKVFRHKRVVFGVNSSPFLLAAVIDTHLRNVSEEHQYFAKELLKSFYVDNCLASVDSYEEYELFKQQATTIMSAAKMDLRNWEHTEFRNVNEDINELSCSKVLGLTWEKASDSLFCDSNLSDDEVSVKLTKRSILSLISRLFDPLGMLCPAVLPVKIILQEAWLSKLPWDAELPPEYEVKIKRWVKELGELNRVNIPRYLRGDTHSRELHTFCDASLSAYAAVSFLKVVLPDNNTSVTLVMAKSRLAPLKRPTIPRLELLACTIGARLSNYIVEKLNLPSSQSVLWSDSTTALAWINRNDQWGTFVGNRVKEIRELTNDMTWNHVPGIFNPADLPSRGCTPLHLVESRWWEGPEWLYQPTVPWAFENPPVDESIVISELKKTVSTVTACNTNDSSPQPECWCMFMHDSDTNYQHSMRVMCWIRRFIQNCQKSKVKLTGNLSPNEYEITQSVVFKIIQSEKFPQDVSVINGLSVVKNESGLYCVRTKLTQKNDTDSFRLPVLLPSDHPMIISLIRWYHIQNHHAGVQYLMSRMREHFWILRSRKTINKVIRKCVTCLRHASKHYKVDTGTLPCNRIETKNAFQTTGVDLAGPLYLKNNEKAWIVLFTCAVYRGVHLDYVTSLSTEAFISAFERFINSKGRPDVIYSDNGTNFTGAANLFKRIDWSRIADIYGCQQIRWIFNPPTAAWWGGWWERLVGLVKNLLKRMLGNARLNQDQLRTCLCQVENLLNERPLTVVTEDQEDLIPLTPAMFMRGISFASFPESHDIQADLSSAYRRRQQILNELKTRFRNEYLSMLVQKSTEKKPKSNLSPAPKVGDIVLVGSDDKRRVMWPLAVIIELIPGRDGIARTAKVKTQNGIMLRPVQRLYSLEVGTAAEANVLRNQNQLTEPNDGIPVQDNIPSPMYHKESVEPVLTRSGRSTKRPDRLKDYE